MITIKTDWVAWTFWLFQVWPLRTKLLQTFLHLYCDGQVREFFSCTEQSHRGYVCLAIIQGTHFPKYSNWLTKLKNERVTLQNLRMTTNQQHQVPKGSRRGVGVKIIIISKEAEVGSRRHVCGFRCSFLCFSIYIHVKRFMCQILFTSLKIIKDYVNFTFYSIPYKKSSSQVGALGSAVFTDPTWQKSGLLGP